MRRVLIVAAMAGLMTQARAAVEQAGGVVTDNPDEADVVVGTREELAALDMGEPISMDTPLRERAAAVVYALRAEREPVPQVFSYEPRQPRRDYPQGLAGLRRQERQHGNRRKR